MTKFEKMLVQNVLESAERFVKDRAEARFPPPEEAIAIQIDNIRQAAEIIRQVRTRNRKGAWKIKDGLLIQHA